MARTFTFINDAKLVEILQSAQRYVIFAAPCISLPIAKEIIEFQRRSPGKLRLILDVDAEPMRLGFGDPEGLPLLHDNGIEIGKGEGLRIGVLVVDGDAWVYSPTPEIILEQPDDKLSNAVKVSTVFALEMVPALSPELARELDILDANVLTEDASNTEPEIGIQNASSAEIEAVKHSIAENPPVKFDRKRQLRVYEGLFQFIEFHFKGGNITSHTITIPSDLLNIADEDSDLRNRIRSTCRLVDANNPFARKFGEFRRKVGKLRNDYVLPLGERYGSIILCKIRPEFDRKVESTREEMKKLVENISSELQNAIDENRQNLVELLLPGFKENPPASLRSRTLFDLTEDDLRTHIENGLDKVIPTAVDLIGEMELNCDYKNITYEMLTDARFVELVKEKFGLEIEALHTEESAAGERNATA